LLKKSQLIALLDQGLGLLLHFLDEVLLFELVEMLLEQWLIFARLLVSFEEEWLQEGIHHEGTIQGPEENEDHALDAAIEGYHPQEHVGDETDEVEEGEDEPEGEPPIAAVVSVEAKRPGK